MTVIAYRDGVLAADTLITSGGTRAGYTAKLAEINGWLVAGCGNLGILHVGRHWLHGRDGTGPNVNLPVEFGKIDDAALMFVSPKGKVYTTDTGSGFVSEIKNPYYALGSGSEIALAAMALGHSAIEAATLAAKLELRCGGKILWINLKGERQLKISKKDLQFS